MKKIKSIIIALLVLVSFSLNAQSSLSQEQEIEYQQRCDILKDWVLCRPLAEETYIKVWFIPECAYKWYTIIPDDDYLIIAIRNDDNGEVGGPYYSAIIKSVEFIEFDEPNTGAITAALECKTQIKFIDETLTKNFTFIQDYNNIFKFYLTCNQ